MILLQMTALGFGIYMIFWSFLSYKKRLFYLNELYFWTTVWSAFILVTIFPGTLKIILQTFNINRTMDLLMILAFMIIWAITFKNYLDNQSLKNKLNELVKKEAINKALNAHKISKKNK